MNRNDRNIGSAIDLFIGAIVVCSLVYLNACATAIVPRNASWEAPPDVWICDTAPAWTTDSISKARDFWADQGVSMGTVLRGPCDDLCGEKRLVPCIKRAIVVDLRDSGAYAEEHADETISPEGEVRQWSAILVPQVILGSDDPTSMRILPADVNDIVMAHALGHALGYGHTYTPMIGGFMAIKTGHVMHPEITKAGWGTEGI